MIAERIGWGHGITTLCDRVATLRPLRWAKMGAGVRNQVTIKATFVRDHRKAD